MGQINSYVGSKTLLGSAPGREEGLDLRVHGGRRLELQRLAEVQLRHAPIAVGVELGEAQRELLLVDLRWDTSMKLNCLRENET